MKKDPGKSKGTHGGLPREEGKYLSLEEENTMESLPTETEFLEMFAKLENVIKSEILNVRTDMGHLLKGVEIVEEVSDKQDREIVVLKQQLRNLQLAQRDLLYKIEEQESRRQNLRLRSLPEQHGEDLTTKIKAIFNPILDRPF